MNKQLEDEIIQVLEAINTSPSHALSWQKDFKRADGKTSSDTLGNLVERIKKQKKS